MSNYQNFVHSVSDSAGNIYIVGASNVVSNIRTDALIVKFDSSLIIQSTSLIGNSSSNSNDYALFAMAAIDSSGDIICVGDCTIGGDQYGLIVKYDTDLNVLEQKIFGVASAGCVFFGLKIDSSGSIYAVGYIENPVSTGYNGLILKLDGSLGLLEAKLYGSTRLNADDNVWGVSIDSSGNLVCFGGTNEAGAGAYNRTILKCPSTLPSGTFSSPAIPALVFQDLPTPTLATSTLTVTIQSLILTASTYVTSDAGLTSSTGLLTATEGSMS